MASTHSQVQYSDDSVSPDHMPPDSIKYSTRSDNSISTATSDSSTSTATSDSGTSTGTSAGSTSTAISDSGTSTGTSAGSTSTAISDSGTYTATSDRGTATSDRGTATSDRGTATSDSGTATATSDSGTSTATSDSGTSTATSDSDTSTAASDSGISTAASDSSIFTAASDSSIFTAASDSNSSTATSDSNSSTATSDSPTSTARLDKDVPRTNSSFKKSPGEEQKKKRKYQIDAECSSSSPSEEIPKVRKISPSVSESQSSQCSKQRDGPLTMEDLPPSTTKKWDADLLFDNLRIRVRTNSDFVENFTQNMFDEEYMKAYNEYKHANKDMVDSLEYIIKSQLKMINVTSVNTADLYGQIKDVETVLQAKIDELTVTERVNPPKSKDICIRAVIFGKDFVKVLKRMVAMNFDSLSGKMYEELFIKFLEMFSLEFSEPIFVKPVCLTVRFSRAERCVTSKPDVLIGFTEPDHEAFEKRSVAVCEFQMRKECHRVGKQIHWETGSQAGEELEVKEEKENHIPIMSRLLGQHGGDLLVHLPDSVFKGKGILGMIVQATEVSITALVPEEDYMVHLKEGFKRELKEATLFINEPYNFLTRSGRSKLCKFLVELFCVQNVCMEKQEQT